MSRWGRLAATFSILVVAGCLESAPTDIPEGSDAPALEAAPPIPDKLLWRQLEPAANPGGEMSAAVLDGKIYIVGGRLTYNNVDGMAAGPGSVITLRTLEIYDIATDTWTTGPDYPVQVDHYVIIGHEGFVYVFFGDNSYKLDVAAMEWKPIAPPPESHGAGTGGLDAATGKIYLAGGSLTLHRYDPVADAYEELAPPTIQRDHTAGAFCSGKFYLGNGDVDGHSITTADLEIFDPAAGAWTLGTPNPVNRGSTAGACWMGRFVVAGGQNQSTGVDQGDLIGFGQPAYDDVHAYDDATSTWVDLPAMPHGRHGFGLVSWEGKLYAVKGAPQEGVSGFADLTVLEPSM